MKCTNRSKRIASFLCSACIVIASLMGCGQASVSLEKAYNAYSYQSSFVNENVSVNAEYFGNDLCVTNTINFGTEDTYAEVAQGAGVFNVTTGEVLYNQDIFKKLYPASTTKIMTAYLIIRDCNLGDIVTISETAADQPSDASVCGLKAGDHIIVRDLLYGLMLNSGNDAADALAEYYAGSVEAFGEIMTKEAQKLGATNSNFKNPSGFPDEEHYTTVYDMYLIFKEAIKLEKFVEIINTKSQAVVYTNKSGATVQRTYNNSNRYLKGTVEMPTDIEVIGGKTGTTGAAGYCLVLYSKNSSGNDIISIVFKADGRHNLYLLMSQILSKFAK